MCYVYTGYHALARLLLHHTYTPPAVVPYPLLLHPHLRRHAIAKDSSGKGNDISLLSSPSRMDTEIKSGGNALRTGSLGFKNNVALNKAVKGMPEKSFTVEFWARSKKLDSNKPDMQVRGALGRCLFGWLA
jgi:hypothetical protein